MGQRNTRCQLTALLVGRHPTTMFAMESDPSRALRFVGAVVAFAVLVCAVTALVVAVESSGASDQTVRFLIKAFTYSGFGAAVIGWKWPHAVLSPFKHLLALFTQRGSRLGANHGTNASAASPLDSRLRSSVQRSLFAIGCIGLVPWMLMRVLRELKYSNGLRDYLLSVFVDPLSPWFESGWWWQTMLRWYDWPVLPCLVAICLAFAWPYTGARVVAWVRGTK
jgi:hypothetical protein